MKEKKQENKNSPWSEEASTTLPWSFLNIPFWPITRAALGALDKASSSAVFQSYKSSDVSACDTEITGDTKKAKDSQWTTHFDSNDCYKLNTNIAILKC